MANRFLTREEATRHIGVPMLRILALQARAHGGVVANPIFPDLIPIDLGNDPAVADALEGLANEIEGYVCVGLQVGQA